MFVLTLPRWSWRPSDSRHWIKPLGRQLSSPISGLPRLRHGEGRRWRPGGCGLSALHLSFPPPSALLYPASTLVSQTLTQAQGTEEKAQLRPCPHAAQSPSWKTDLGKHQLKCDLCRRVSECTRYREWGGRLCPGHCRWVTGQVVSRKWKTKGSSGQMFPVRISTWNACTAEGDPSGPGERALNVEAQRARTER